MTVNPCSYFGEKQRMAVRSYCGNQFCAGRCLQCLVQKKNGCKPSGQGRKQVLDH